MKRLAPVPRYHVATISRFPWGGKNTSVFDLRRKITQKPNTQHKNQDWPLKSALLNLKNKCLISTTLGLKTRILKFIRNLNRDAYNLHACEYRKNLTFVALLESIFVRRGGVFPTPFFFTAAIDRSTMSWGKEKPLSLQPLPSATIFLLVWCGCAFHPRHFF